jgi:hypothetical protein
MIKEKLYNDILNYCKINNIEDIDTEINNILQIGFNVVRFGMTPFNNTPIIVSESSKEVVKRGRKKKEEIVKPTIVEEVIVENKPQKKTKIIKN